MFKEPNVADELSEARAALIRTLESRIPADDLLFLKNGCVDEIIKDMKRNESALLLGEYRYSVIDDVSVVITLVKAVLLKEALELRGLNVEIVNPEPTADYQVPVYSRTIVITGWVK